MMKRFALALILFGGLLSAAVNPFRSYPPAYRGAIEAILALPEAEPLLEQVAAEGGVRVVAGSSGGFGGYWDGARRTIIVTSPASMGNAISTILFELHNAASGRDFEALIAQAYWGQIDRSGYVEGVERIEHRNGLQTSELLRQGRERALFPRDSRMTVYEKFEDYFRYQQRAGHSGWIASSFDQMFANPA